MSRVVMFVLGDVRFDARVLREATTLVDAGHAVTVVGRTSDPRALAAERDQRNGIEILRVPVPGRLRRLLVRPRPAASPSTAMTDLAGGAARSRAPAAGIVGAAGAVAGALASALRGLSWLARLELGAFAWARAAARATPIADIWHGHDLPGLAAAAAAQRAHGGRLLYDAHEIYVEAGMSAERPRWAKSVTVWRERGLVRRAEAVITVNDAIAARLASMLRPRRLVVVHNCPPFTTPPPAGVGAGPLRRAAGLDPDVSVALYHGALTRWRGIEQLLAAILEPGLEGVHAVLLGAGPLGPGLREAAREVRFRGRVHVLDAVDPAVLESWVADADVGVMAIAPSTLNHRLSTPNKLFECLAAGVPVVASDFPPIRAIVRDDPDGPLGVLCDPMDVGSVTDGIRTILGMSTRSKADLRERCLRAARERWNWQIESRKLVDLYASLDAAR